MNPDEKPFLPEATALRQGTEARVPEEEAARADERSSRNLIGALRDEPDPFAQLVATVPGGLFSFRLRPDGSTCCPYANPAFLELFGLPAEDLAESAAALWATLHPDDLDRVRASVATSARSLTPWRDEFRWRRPNGEEIWVEGHSRPVREPDGSILWHGFLHDITARKETERRLCATHERLQALLQALPVGVSFSEDATCQHITGNPMLRAQFEMTPQDNLSASALETAALGRRVRYFFDGQELREVELPLQRAVAENRVIPPLELVVQLPSGRRWIAEILAAPLRDAQDRIIGGLAVILDITERKQAEERYQTLFEHMLDGFALHEILCDARGRPVDYRFLAVNPAFERLTGLKANAIVGKTVLEVLPGTEPYWIETYGRVALTGEPASFENYARDLDQYFQVTAFRPAPRQFACLFVDITARKRAEDVLWKTQNRLAEAQKIAHLGSFEYDVATQQTVWSDEEYRIYGLEPAQPSPAYDRLLAQCIHPEDMALLHQTFTTALQRGSVYELEHRIVRPDGRVRWVYDLAHPHFDANGQLVRYIGTTLDITERQHAAEALRLGEERLRLALEGARLGTFHWTVATGDIVWSGTYLQLHGLPPGAQGSYEGWLASLHPEDREPADRQIRLAMENHTDFDTEYRIPWPDGTQRWLAAKGRFFYGADGAPQRMEGVVTDITDRKNDEERLRRSEERLRLATDGAELGIWYWDMSTDTLEWSDRCKRHLGLPPGQEPSFEHFYAVMHPDDRDRIERLLAQAVETGSDYRAEYRVTWPDGSLHWISAPGRVYGAAHGALIGMGGVTIDITARKRAEAEQEHLQTQLVQAQKMESIGRLAGGVAHDFNNLLGVILGYTELALENANPVQPLYADLLEIQKAAQRSADLTRQLLAFARKQTIAPQVCDLNETVAGMLKMLRRLIGESIVLSWRPGSPLWPVKVDPAQIDQILANLCVNARDAIAGVGQITIETGNVTLDATDGAPHAGFVPGEYVRLAVSDDGCGMDAETLAHLFEPFFTTKGVGRGTGLGLATLYGVVQQNRGFIHVSSAPGQGTTFTLYWPRHRDKGAPAALAGPAAPASCGHETVLLVEDEPALLHLGTTMLEKLGYRVLAADTPGEAIRLAEEHAGAIHLLMTDVVMPEMNGRDLARRLLSLYPNLKRLFMSGYPANVIAPHGVLDDGVHFLQKPFALQELAAKIRAALEREP